MAQTRNQLHAQYETTHAKIVADEADLNATDFIVADTAAAATALASVVKPIIGAIDSPDFTLAQLNQRLNGTGTAPAHTFPTAQ